TEVSLITDLDKKIKGISVTEVVTAIISLALQIEASDIHIEAEENDVKVRYRVDGILNDATVLPKETWPKITSRIKLLAGLKINIENKPQDGRFTIFLSKDQVDVRVSVIPTTYGESIVMRLLRSTAVGLKFEDLGITGRAFADIENEIKKPNGMIITTGPTGSGKTTTLYAVLTRLNTTATKIITLEDPIEYKLEGINQSQVDRSKGYTFAEGLRSILRQDPDIVMVGEIRDLETADVAINAALTGHLVISTLHTNSAAAGIPRFMAMGVKPFLLAPALNAIVGQRLVRKICPACREEVELDTKTRGEVLKILEKIPPETAAQILTEELHQLKFYKGGGCVECHGIGYKGRIGIYEIMIMVKEIEDLILAGQVSEFKMQEVAVKNGMVTMVQDGLIKASRATTTVDEVFRVAKTIG
ncbi:MAG TPA: GspE/PulE family protein, partial [Patescibacteria group bacterium]